MEDKTKKLIDLCFAVEHVAQKSLQVFLNFITDFKSQPSRPLIQALQGFRPVVLVKPHQDHEWLWLDQLVGFWRLSAPHMSAGVDPAAPSSSYE